MPVDCNCIFKPSHPWISTTIDPTIVYLRSNLTTYFPQDDNIYNAIDSLVVNNGGLKEAYYAYNAWAKQHNVEPRLPGLQEYTPQQMIWMSAVNAQCFKLVNRYFNSSFIAEYHLIKQGLIINPLLNLDDFSNDFRCPLGSTMNPAEKCRIF